MLLGESWQLCWATGLSTASGFWNGVGEVMGVMHSQAGTWVLCVIASLVQK